MSTLVVKGPLAVAHGAMRLFFVLFMGRMDRSGHNESLAAQSSNEHKVLGFNMQVVQRKGQSFPPAVATEAGHGFFFFGGSPVCAHEFRSAVAIDAGHAFLLVDVRGQLVKLNPVRPGFRVVGAVWGTVFQVEIVLEAAMVIRAHEVAVMAVQTLAVGWGFAEPVACHLAAFVSEMAGGAPGAARRFRITVTGIVHMAVEAAAAQKVIDQIERGDYCFMGRDFPESGKGGLGAKGGPNGIDFVMQGKMGRGSSRGHLGTMAVTATFLHLIRMRRLGNESDMGLVLRCSLCVPAVAVGAGEIVVGVKPDRRVASLASGSTHNLSSIFLNSGFFRGLAFFAAGDGQEQEAEKQQDGAMFFVETKRHDRPYILGIDDFRHTTLFAAKATSRNCFGRRDLSAQMCG